MQRERIAAIIADRIAAGFIAVDAHGCTDAAALGVPNGVAYPNSDIDCSRREGKREEQGGRKREIERERES